MWPSILMKNENRYYMLNVSTNHICVLKPGAEVPETEAERMAKAASNGIGRLLTGEWKRHRELEVKRIQQAQNVYWIPNPGSLDFQQGGKLNWIAEGRTRKSSNQSTGSIQDAPSGEILVDVENSVNVSDESEILIEVEEPGTFEVMEELMEEGIQAPPMTWKCISHKGQTLRVGIEVDEIPTARLKIDFQNADQIAVSIYGDEYPIPSFGTMIFQRVTFRDPIEAPKPSAISTKD